MEVVWSCVSPGDRHAVFESHQFRQHFGSRNNWNEIMSRGQDFHVVRATADEVTTTSALAMFSVDDRGNLGAHFGERW